MQITKIEALENGKKRVYIYDEPAFLLYSREVKEYKLQEDHELTQEIYDQILEKVLLKRAKARTLYLLKSSNRTESQIRQKLEQNEYPEAVIDLAVEYAKSYHYIDDDLYAENYIRYKASSKSKRQITQDLFRKGINNEIIQRAYEALEGEITDENDLIRALVAKKGINIEQASDQELQKLYQFLQRKGFSSYEIRSVLFERKY